MGKQTVVHSDKGLLWINPSYADIRFRANTIRELDFDHIKNKKGTNK
jgi:hypothetical protein